MSAELKVQQSLSDKVKLATRAILPEKVLDVARKAYHNIYLRNSEEPIYPQTIEVPFSAGSIRLQVATENEKYEASSLLEEREYIEEIMSTLKPDTVFWDVGGNIGVHSLAASLIVKEGQILSFEPDPDIQRGLEDNIGLNGAPVHPIQCAIWGHDTILQLHSDGRGGDAPSVSSVSDNSKVNPSLLAEARSIESLVQDGMVAPEVLKIDVEGAEFEVIKGLGPYRPKHIFIEVHLLVCKEVYQLGYKLGEMGYKPASKARQRGNELLCHFTLR